VKTFETRTGVVLELRMVGAWLVNQARRSLKEPQVPVQMIEDKGREEPNPNHPDYIAAMEQYQAQLANLIMDTYLYLGTVLVSKPDNLPGPNDGDWAEELALFGIPTRDTKLRYADWIKNVVLRGDMEEFTALREAIGNVNAVTETAVAEAADSFRGIPERDGDLGAPVTEISANRNRVRGRAAGVGK
jgi:hypothetical protein